MTLNSLLNYPLVIITLAQQFVRHFVIKTRQIQISAYLAENLPYAADGDRWYSYGQKCAISTFRTIELLENNRTHSVPVVGGIPTFLLPMGGIPAFLHSYCVGKVDNRDNGLFWEGTCCFYYVIVTP